MIRLFLFLISFIVTEHQQPYIPNYDFQNLTRDCDANSVVSVWTMYVQLCAGDVSRSVVSHCDEGSQPTARYTRRATIRSLHNNGQDELYGLFIVRQVGSYCRHLFLRQTGQNDRHVYRKGEFTNIPVKFLVCFVTCWQIDVLIVTKTHAFVLSLESLGTWLYRRTGLTSYL